MTTQPCQNPRTGSQRYQAGVVGLLCALVGALVLARPAGAQAPDIAERYEIHQMEMAGGLELNPNGQFRYALEYGAVSEQGSGKWSRDGNLVRLTSDPMPRAPNFVLLRDDPEPAGEVYAILAPPGFGGWTGRLQLLVSVAGESETELVEADEAGRVILNEDQIATALQPVVPLTEDPGPFIPLSSDRGHRLLLRFLPNDFGKARFDNEPLSIDGRALIMNRWDATIRFEPVEQK